MVAAAAASAATALSRPAAVLAGSDGDVVLGASNSATTPTRINSSGTDAALEATTSSDTGWAIHATSTKYPTIFASSSENAALYGVSGGSNAAVLGSCTGAGPGVIGSAGLNHTTAPAGTGVFGYGAQGVAGQGDGISGFTGVQGYTGPGNPPVTVPASVTAPTGVFGTASGSGPTGVWGDGGIAATGFSTGVYGEGDVGVWGFGGWGMFGAANVTGTGMYGVAGAAIPAAPANVGVFGYSATGAGVVAASGSGTALYVDGKLRLRRSGKIAVAAGKTSVAKSLAGVTTGSIIIAVLQTRETGTWVRAAVAGSGKLTVYFNRALPSSSSVGFLVIN